MPASVPLCNAVIVRAYGHEMVIRLSTKIFVLRNCMFFCRVRCEQMIPMGLKGLVIYLLSAEQSRMVISLFFNICATPSTYID